MSSKLSRETEVEFYTGGGPGGQHRNKTESAVRLLHRPTGIRVTATERRSQAANLRVAFERLARAVERYRAVPKTRLATKVPQKSRARRRAEKAHASERKRARGRVGDSD